MMTFCWHDSMIDYTHDKDVGDYIRVCIYGINYKKVMIMKTVYHTLYEYCPFLLPLCRSDVLLVVMS